ncbi:hypothetical protein GCM10009715_40100 [Paeniglutamicibacter psychrophenolicus]|uniref:MarR family transcriptional regulator n=1 Tax=Paeniglutamicibacter psychrophenolicus TaxID=257454 RepID=A0ABS4WB84_9MICC|nr:hypothetical protein [Paeniglutamicibacter psychrophenolicus]MBP2373301.1 hypothetical protein [Paeniglutamicibacter psychrophenolicus]
MDVDVVALLRELDFGIAEGTSERSWLLRSPEGERFLVNLAKPTERITAHILRSYKPHRGSPVRPLYAGRTATAGVIERARAGEIDMLLEEPLQLILHGLVFTAEYADQPVQIQQRSRRMAWVRWAVKRCLLLADDPLRQSEIARLVGTSQQSVSNVCRQLGELVTATPEGTVTREPQALLEHWLKEYPGAGGQQFGWYSLDPIVEQTLKAVQEAQLLDAHPLVSGDVAADRLMPWKLPARGRIYISSPIDLADVGFVPAPLDEATLVTCVPADPTLWRLTELGTFPVYDDVELADPALVYWDVHDSNDIDSIEAAEHLEALITGIPSL